MAEITVSLFQRSDTCIYTSIHVDCKRDEVTQEWRRLRNKELYTVSFSPNIIRVNKSKRNVWEKHVGRIEESINEYRVLVAKP